MDEEVMLELERGIPCTHFAGTHRPLRRDEKPVFDP